MASQAMETALSTAFLLSWPVGRTLTPQDLNELKARIQLMDSLSTCEELLVFFDSEIGDLSEAEGQIQGFILGAGLEEFSDGTTSELSEECFGDSQ